MMPVLHNQSPTGKTLSTSVYSDSNIAFMNRLFARQYQCLARLLLILIAVASILPSSAATLTVTNLADSGPGTLRDRIAAAAAGDSIRFTVFGTITLGSELVISKNLRIEGGGTTLLKISGNNTSRVFSVTSGVAQIFNLTIANGRVVGTNGPVGFNGQNV